MKKGLFKKGLVLGIIVFFSVSTIIPTINGNVEKQTGSNNEVNVDISDQERSNDVIVDKSQKKIDWWPKFHHDLQNSGYSTSYAPDTNNVIWNFTALGIGISYPAVADNKVYIGSGDYNVYCLNTDTGVQVWNYTTGQDVYSSHAVADGKVYFSSWDFNIYCLDASTGAHIWNNKIGICWFSSPAVVDGKIYIGSFDDKVYCLDASTGDYIWSYKTGNVI